MSGVNPFGLLLLSQGHSLKQVRILLPEPIFSHSQLYVSTSRVTSRNGLKQSVLVGTTFMKQS
ncbi:helicase, putative [Medicago truncatula]|uniref:Helicase, putative n=1 Tax=Medicago truncatula TaxID=3880 RepID=G7L9Z4_MEDTR|nr:helicase, putative [Medicago truncatula]